MNMLSLRPTLLSPCCVMKAVLHKGETFPQHLCDIQGSKSEAVEILKLFHLRWDDPKVKHCI